ncbi:Anthocyanidin 3-O-glucoside 5-O-glucosyltransferase 1 [Acorus gramineus]|uniref:Glycosyltransferase n=1 Tax=Acorus gramineus TaxID=55184 RepID=A0AAV9A5Q2_ACOGR|nr:Anthocyanidin 3-O-glucoside 5-O-glucosyltransferase 1 [Acorus gramineus]
MAKPHFLVVAFPAQGHINPALQLAKRLARSTLSPITFATTPSILRRLNHHSHHPLISFAPISDGTEDGFNPSTGDLKHYFAQLRHLGSESLTELLRSLSDSGRPVKCVVYNFLLPWTADVARDLGVPSVLFWVQPATVFRVYYQYFHDYKPLIDSKKGEPKFTIDFPGLPRLAIADLPSFFQASSKDDTLALPILEELFQILDREEGKVRVLVNTFDALEVDTLGPVGSIELCGIGPMVPSAYVDGEDVSDTGFGGDIFSGGGSSGYKEWLDSKAERSVVYVSFGTTVTLQKRLVEEVLKGLKKSGRPFMWVLRNAKGGEEVASDVGGGEGMVVEWCNQMEVLSHPSIGCFVSHCGWNSTVESLVSGVPMVGMPQWSDQATNAKMVEDWWGMGVRARAEGGEEGGVVAAEIVRCLEVVMGGEEMRDNARRWREAAREAVRENGTSDRNMREFVERIGCGGVVADGNG